jgi:outer membrane protein insertion porin family
VLDFENTEGNKFLNFELNLNWRHDSRDSAVFPRDGYLQSLYGEASIPGSDLQYYKISYENRGYWPLTSDVILSARAEIAYGDRYGGSTLYPLWEHFYGGGPGSIRGFKARSVGPRDSQGDSLGGNAMYAAGLELLFPPPLRQVSDSVRLALFFDAGAVVDTHQTDLFDGSELRYSTGLGLSWLSPVGALTVSYAIPFQADDQDEKEQFQFSLGTTF